jgi:hypothetical protein
MSNPFRHMREKCVIHACQKGSYSYNMVLTTLCWPIQTMFCVYKPGKSSHVTCFAHVNIQKYMIVLFSVYNERKKFICNVFRTYKHKKTI